MATRPTRSAPCQVSPAPACSSVPGRRAGRGCSGLWSGLCVAWLAISNALLFVDLAVIGDETDLRWARSATFLAGTATLLAGLIWDAIGGEKR